MATESNITESTQYLTFTLAGEEFGITILKVREIIAYESLTRVPGAPAGVRGVMNLRGSVIPVVDLAVLFGLSGGAVTPRTCIVVVEVAQEEGQSVMGVIADAVSEVITLGSGDVEPPPAFGTRVRVEYLAGMGKLNKQFILLLEIDRALAFTDLSAAGHAPHPPLREAET